MFTETKFLAGEAHSLQSPKPASISEVLALLSHLQSLLLSLLLLPAAPGKSVHSYEFLRKRMEREEA